MIRFVLSIVLLLAVAMIAPAQVFTSTPDYAGGYHINGSNSSSSHATPDYAGGYYINGSNGSSSHATPDYAGGYYVNRSNGSSSHVTPDYAGGYYINGSNGSFSQVRPDYGGGYSNENVPSKEKVRGTIDGTARFAVGSHKDKVLRIQGTPTNVTRYPHAGYEVWRYGPRSTVRISTQTGRVTKWQNFGNLKVAMKPAGNGGGGYRGAAEPSDMDTLLGISAALVSGGGGFEGFVERYGEVSRYQQMEAERRVR